MCKLFVNRHFLESRTFLVGAIYSSLLLCIFLFISCQEDSRRQTTIDTKIKEKIDEFRNRKLAECRLQALDIAATNADSILLKNADLWQIQGSIIPRPPRIAKPGTPDITIRVDSTPAKPLFPFKKG